jgi:peroxiredoxin
MSAPVVGSIAPDFTTRNQYGQEVTLSQLRGAPVVVVFYPWAFTGICTSELCALRDSLDQFNAVGARVVAVSCDAMFSLRIFAEQENLGFDLLTDHWPHGAIAQSYGVFNGEAGCALRGTFVLDADGVVTWTVVNQIGEPREIARFLDGLISAN